MFKLSDLALLCSCSERVFSGQLLRHCVRLDLRIKQLHFVLQILLVLL